MAENSSSNYYALLGVNPAASVQQIRRAYRDLSKLYHPDTTDLPAAIATNKFQQLNEAYATLSSPERRAAYDLKIGYSRVSVIQPPADLNRPVSESRKYRSSAYLEPHDRPLSPGELFALFILGVTFVACLVLVFTIGFTRGEQAFQPLTASEAIPSSQLSPLSPIESIQPNLTAPDFTPPNSTAPDSTLPDFTPPSLTPPSLTPPDFIAPELSPPSSEAS
jgi:DnaJ domain